jgi:small GTP-binding protein
MSYDYLFKIIVVGEPGVGKSALVEQLCGRTFSQHYNVTIGVEFDTKTIQIDDTIIKSHIWDTAGQEQFAPIVASYFRDCAGAFIVFDVGKQKTFQQIEKWHRQILDYNKERFIPIVLIGNKIDDSYQRVVSKEEGLVFAQKHSMKYIETSAKYNINVDNFFKLLIQDIYKRMDKKKPAIGIKKGFLHQIDGLTLETKDSRKACCSIS